MPLSMDGSPQSMESEPQSEKFDHTETYPRLPEFWSMRVVEH